MWERFERERRLEFGGPTDPNWRDGRALSASFIVPVDASGVRERLKPLRDALRPFPFVSLPPDRFVHITLLLLASWSRSPRARRRSRAGGCGRSRPGPERRCAVSPPSP